MFNFRQKPIRTVLMLAIACALLAQAGIMAAFAAPLGSITVHKYSRGTAGSVTSNTHTGEELADTSALGKPLAGAGFTLYSLDTTNLEAALKFGNGYVKHVINPANQSVTFTLSGLGTPSVTTVTATASVARVEQLTDANGLTLFPSLPTGYYVLVETTTPANHTTVESSLIRLPLTKADGTGHNYDIHVYPKDESTTLPITKTIHGVPKVLNVNDTIAFDVTADFRNEKPDPDHVGSVHDLRDDSATPAVYGQAYIIDTIQQYFSFVGINTVGLLDGAGHPVATLTSSEYTFDTNGLIDGSGPLKIALTNAGIDKAIALDASSFIVTLTTRYDGATAGDNTAGSSPVRNVATSYMIKPGSDDDGEWPTTEVEVPTTLIALTKTNSAGQPFAGATFRLSTVPNPATDADYVKDAAGTIIELTTDAAGKLSFYNLPYDELAGKTYYLHEIATAAGYQLKIGTIAVTLQPKAAVANASLLDGDGNWIKGAVVRADVSVKNYRNDEIDPDEPAFSLPLTGGRGVVFFTAIGMTIMLVAAVAYIKKRAEQH